MQEGWSIWVFLPNSVLIGCTLRQFDLTPQSPHPSHTASLINMRFFGSCTKPRFLNLLKFAAQDWSWTKTVTPFIAFNFFWASTISSLCNISTSLSHLDLSIDLYAPVSSVVTITFLTPCDLRYLVNSGKSNPPSGSWAPVIATALLYKIL